MESIRGNQRERPSTDGEFSTFFLEDANDVSDNSEEKEEEDENGIPANFPAADPSFARTHGAMADGVHRRAGFSRIWEHLQSRGATDESVPTDRRPVARTRGGQADKLTASSTSGWARERERER